MFFPVSGWFAAFVLTLAIEAADRGGPPPAGGARPPPPRRPDRPREPRVPPRGLVRDQPARPRGDAGLHRSSPRPGRSPWRPSSTGRRSAVSRRDARSRSLPLRTPRRGSPDVLSVVSGRTCSNSRSGANRREGISESSGPVCDPGKEPTMIRPHQTGGGRSHGWRSFTSLVTSLTLLAACQGTVTVSPSAPGGSPAASASAQPSLTPTSTAPASTTSPTAEPTSHAGSAGREMGAGGNDGRRQPGRAGRPSGRRTRAGRRGAAPTSRRSATAASRPNCGIQRPAAGTRPRASTSRVASSRPCRCWTVARS